MVFSTDLVSQGLNLISISISGMNSVGRKLPMKPNRFFAPSTKQNPVHPLPEIEVTSSFQIPSIQIVGLANTEIQEAKERVRSAIQESGFEIPSRKIIVNLSPAHEPKKGTGWDLGIALAIVCHQELYLKPKKILAWAELSLNGECKSAGKTFQSLKSALIHQVDLLLLSSEDECAVQKILQWGLVSTNELKSLKIIFSKNLRSAIEAVISEKPIAPIKPVERSTTDLDPNSASELLPLTSWFYDLVGIAVSGDHSVLLMGAKGSGKSSLIQWFQALQIPASKSEQAETLVRSELRDPFFIHQCETPKTFTHPFRKMSPLIKPSTLVGRWHGSSWTPGELALCHGGYLIADEFLEWARDSREILRGPLETGVVHIQRGILSETYPAHFRFLATANLCPCGDWTPLEPEKCRCPGYKRQDYQKRLSGPIFDRIGIVQILENRKRDCALESAQEQFLKLTDRIHHTREVLIKRFGKTPGKLSDVEIHKIVQQDPNFRRMQQDYPNESLRFYHQRARVALTAQAWQGLSEPDTMMAQQLYVSPWKLEA
jgi:magnesium chelatase family protein